MSKEKASLESLQNLYNDMGISINVGTINLCHSVSDVENRKRQLDGLTEDNKQHREIELGFIFAQLNFFSNIISLDIATAWRANSRAESNFEKRNNLKYLAVITIEGYKYLFGKDRGDRKLTLLRRLETLVQLSGDDDLKDDIAALRECGRTFVKEFLRKQDIGARNLTTHYDYDPIKVYNYLSSIDNENVEAQRIGLFQVVINELNRIILKGICKYNLVLNANATIYNLRVKESLNRFPDKGQKMFCRMQETISKYTKTLDKFVHSQQLPTKMSLDERLSKYDMSDIVDIANSINPTIHIHFIILDIACALRAYLSSEQYMERQLNLRRINVIIYEGFKKIYGYDETQKEVSFWNNHIIKPLQSSSNLTNVEFGSLLESRLKEIALDPSINIEEVRECLVHYRYEERDNTVALFKFAFSTNVFGQFFTALKFICILPEIMKLNAHLAQELGRAYTKKVDSKRQIQADKFRSLIPLMEASSATEDVKKKNVAQLKTIIGIIENPLSICKKHKK